MSRIMLIHWNLDEARERAAWLERAGHEVECGWEEGGAPLRAARGNPPDAFVIDLRRLPSHGREAAEWIRQQKPTRHVPIVFVEGDPEKTKRVRESLPDAVYTEWSRVRGAIRRAIAGPPREPVVPARPYYTTTPLTKKLGIQAGSVVAIIGAPPGFERMLGRLPEGARIRRDARGRTDVLLIFAKSKAELTRRFASARSASDRGRLWLAWPKKASGVASDLDGAVVREVGVRAGLAEYKVVAIDKTWSGVCFGRRRRSTPY